MNPKIRNRLVGAAALLCLLIIIVPLLNPEPEDAATEMPSPPLPPSLQAPTQVEATSVDRQQQDIDKRFTEWDDFEKKENKNAAAAQSGACRLRMGIFASPEKIVQRLREDGRQTSLQYWGEGPEGVRLFAVHIDGIMECAEAERLRDELQERYDVQPLIEYNTQTP